MRQAGQCLLRMRDSETCDGEIYDGTLIDQLKGYQSTASLDYRVKYNVYFTGIHTGLIWCENLQLHLIGID